MRTAIQTDAAPAAIGPYSQAIRSGDLLFVSGQIPIDPETGDIVSGDVGAQTQRVMQNLGAILDTAGATFEHVVRTTVFLINLDDFALMNEVYSTYFTSPEPARSTLEVTALPKGTSVAIDVIASLDCPCVD